MNRMKLNNAVEGTLSKSHYTFRISELKREHNRISKLLNEYYNRNDNYYTSTIERLLNQQHNLHNEIVELENALLQTNN